jgi:hypothetical protein
MSLSTSLAHLFGLDRAALERPLPLTTNLAGSRSPAEPLLHPSRPAEGISPRREDTSPAR